MDGYSTNGSLPIASTQPVTKDLTDLIRRNSELIAANNVKLREAGKSVDVSKIRVPPSTPKRWETFQVHRPVYHQTELALWNADDQH
jgi:hypothetical protein